VIDAFAGPVDVALMVQSGEGANRSRRRRQQDRVGVLGRLMDPRIASSWLRNAVPRRDEGACIGRLGVARGLFVAS